MPRSMVALLICCFVLSGSSVRADEIIVDNVLGADTNSGRVGDVRAPQSGPVRSIGRALQIEKKGDRIFVRNTGTPYREMLAIQGGKHSGTSVMPFRIVSDGAILDGTQMIPKYDWEHVKGDVFRFQPRLLTFQQLYHGEQPIDRVSIDSERELDQLQVQQWAFFNGWIYYRCEEKRAPSEYDLACCSYETGITLYQVDHVLIEGLVVQGFQLDGINAHGSVLNTEIERCTLRGNGRSGLSVGGASHVLLVDSLVGDNYSSQIRSEGHSQLTVQRSDLLDTAPYGPRFHTEGGRIVIDGVIHRPVGVPPSR